MKKKETKTTTSVMNNNPLLQLLSLLVKQDPPEPYIVLLQQSSCYSFATRQIAASKDKDVAVYERASMKTPSQRAQLDLQPWIIHLLIFIASLYKKTITKQQQQQQQQQPKKKVVWLETIGGKFDESMLKRHAEVVTIISTAQNPLGWDNDTTNTNTTTTTTATDPSPLFGNLEALLLKLEQEGEHTSVIVIESLTPLLMLHGVDVVVLFLQRLRVPVMVPIERSFLNTTQHMMLEDAAHAVLMIDGGDATLIRRGVRERSNVLREHVPFILDETTNGLKLLSSNDTLATKKDTTTMTTDSSVVGNGIHEPVAPLQPPPPPSSSSLRPTTTTTSTGKVILRHEEDNGPPTPLTRPKIYLQDDDPEFDDLDEEDPDDDLDI